MLCLPLFLALYLPFCISSPLTFSIPSNEAVCIYYDVGAPGEVELEVFSTTGIPLTVKGPLTLDSDGIPLPGLLEKSSINVTPAQVDSSLGGTFLHTVETMVGTYELCLENSGYLSAQDLVSLDVKPKNKAREKEAGKHMLEGDLAVLARSLEHLGKSFEEIEQKQERERKRLAVQSLVNLNAQSGVLTASVLETITFFGACLFQIIFVRRWFSGCGGMIKQWA
ncbi:unnamed protein product [Chrysoparadoxa australica]